MFLRNLITTSTKDYSKQIDRLKKEIEKADAIVIGAGAGMSTSAGFFYDGERFEKYFSDLWFACLTAFDQRDQRAGKDPTGAQRLPERVTGRAEFLVFHDLLDTGFRFIQVFAD